MLNQDMKNKMFLIFFGVLTWWFLTNLNLVGNFFGYLIGAFMPLIIGFVIAYIINLPMNYMENKVLIKFKLKEKNKRNLSLVLTLILFTLVIVLTSLVIIPNLINASLEIKNKIPEYLSYIDDLIASRTFKHSYIKELLEKIDFHKVYDSVSQFIKGGFFNILGSTYNFATTLFGNLITLLLGFIFSIYFLVDKESISGSLIKLMELSLPKRVQNSIMNTLRIANKAFSDFILAQSIEAIIIGLMFFIVLSLFKFPYATMISVVISVFSIIPVVGAFVGLFIGFFLIFVENPHLAGIFIILFFVLQQIEGNIIYPKVVGKLAGLSPTLTLVAVTLGGSLMGVLGILVFIPIFSTAQTLIRNEISLRQRLN